MYWFCEIRANTVDRELLSLMYKAGCRSVAMGVESASPRILKNIVKKGIELEQASATVKICKELGIYIKAFFSYSYPEETLEDVKMTLAFIETIKPDAYPLTRLKVYPGTAICRLAEKMNLLPEDFNWFKFYKFYDSFSNDTCMPWFVDKLTFKDFLWIEDEVISRNENLKKQQGIFDIIKTALKVFRRVKSFGDCRIVLTKISARFKLLFLSSKRNR